MYVFEFTSSYVKRDVRDSDDEREILKERKAAAISVELPDSMKSLHELLSQHVEKHVRCVLENPYI